MLTRTDQLILSTLQNNAELTAHQLGQTLDLSPSQAHRRRQRLESEGYISEITAKLDPVRVGLVIQAFLFVTVDLNGSKSSEPLVRLIHSLPQIVGAWNLTGDAGYLLRVFCRELSDLQHLVHDVLLCHESVARVQSHIVMDQSKQDSPLPVSER